MDAPYYNGDENRDLSPDDESCPDCHVGSMEVCRPECECRYCVRARLRRLVEDEVSLDAETIELLQLKGML